MDTETSLSEAVEAAKQLAARFPEIPGGKRWEILTDDFAGFDTQGTREFLVIYLTPEERGWFQTRTLECLLGIEMYSQGNPVAVNVDYLASYLRHSMTLMEGILNQILAAEKTS